MATTEDADYRVLLDTGSTDGTDEIAQAAGVHVGRASFDPFRFDDARNAALAIVPPEVSLCLRLDADERLPDDWRETIADFYHPDVLRYRYTVHNNGNGWDRIIRDDLHARHGFRWKYPTHEVLVGPPGPIIPLTVEHYPPGELRTHHRSNLAVLRAATIESPYDLRMAFYLGRECWYQGLWDDCRAEMLRFLNLPGGWAPERAEAWRILGHIDTFPERWFWRAIGECPARREPWVSLTRYLLAAGRVDEARAALCFAAERNDASIYTTDQNCWGPAFDALRNEVELMTA